MRKGVIMRVFVVWCVLFFSVSFVLSATDPGYVSPWLSQQQGLFGFSYLSIGAAVTGLLLFLLFFMMLLLIIVLRRKKKRTPKPVSSVTPLRVPPTRSGVPPITPASIAARSIVPQQSPATSQPGPSQAPMPASPVSQPQAPPLLQTQASSQQTPQTSAAPLQNRGGYSNIQSVSYVKYYAQNLSHDPRVRIKYLLSAGLKFIQVRDLDSAKQIYSHIFEDYHKLTNHDDLLYNEIVSFKEKIV